MTKTRDEDSEVTMDVCRTLAPYFGEELTADRVERIEALQVGLKLEDPAMDHTHPG